MTENTCGSQAVSLTDKSTYHQPYGLLDLKLFQNMSHPDFIPYFKRNCSNKIHESSVHKSVLSHRSQLKNHYTLIFLSCNHRIPSQLLIGYTTGSTTVHGVPDQVRFFRIKNITLSFTGNFIIRQSRSPEQGDQWESPLNKDLIWWIWDYMHMKHNNDFLLLWWKQVKHEVECREYCTSTAQRKHKEL